MTLAILDDVVPRAPAASRRAVALDRWLLSPWGGFLTVAVVLYFGMYKLVGGVAAGSLVDWLESAVFDGPAALACASFVRDVIPWRPLQDMVVGPYGLVTVGLRYAFAIVLPIVSVFFLVFAVLEDSGYLPRLALLMDRGLKRIGLSGRAVIPLVLGFGCGTMATLVTRTLETRRERVIATLLLALAVPCSAQLGVVLGILSVSPAAVGIWALTLLGVFVTVGWAAARLVPGAPPSLYLELPPLRLPLLRNVLVKTGTRTRWYLAEVVPLFLLASVLLWFGDWTGLLEAATAALVPVVRLVSLPDAAAPAFLYGFFRRDFGAAGLYDLASRGALSVPALTTAAIVITLFVPCIAQFVMMRRERGLRTALAVLVTATVVAFAVGGVIGWALRLGGWS
jgi:ferrous iron transport protein B